MSQRRPPDDETDHDQADGDRAAGLRSQTRAVPGNAPAAPRTGKHEWGMTKPLDHEGLGAARPTPMRPEPGRAFARKESSAEPAVRVARSVVAGTPSSDDEGGRSARPQTPPVSAQRPGPDRTHLLGSAAEPLRAPSGRPAPAPYQSAKATLLMTDSQPQPAAPARAKTEDRTREGDSGRRAQAPSGVSAGRHPGGTLPVEEADIRASAPAAASARNMAMASGTPRRGPGSTTPVPQSPAVGGDGEPLRLQLDAGDVLEQPVDVGPPGPGGGGNSRLIIALLVVVVVAGGAGIWYGMSGSASEPAAEVPPTRNDMQPAETAPAQPIAVPTAVPAAQPAAAAVPGGQQPAAAAQPTAVPATRQPTAVAPVGDHEEPEAAAPRAESTKAPAKKPEPRRAARRRPAKSSAPVSPDVAAAREALKNLGSGPVMRVEPSEDIPAPDEGPSDAPPPPPEPPPPDPE